MNPLEPVFALLPAGTVVGRRLLVFFERFLKFVNARLGGIELVNEAIMVGGFVTNDGLHSDAVLGCKLRF